MTPQIAILFFSIAALAVAVILKTFSFRASRQFKLFRQGRRLGWKYGGFFLDGWNLELVLKRGNLRVTFTRGVIQVLGSRARRESWRRFETFYELNKHIRYDTVEEIRAKSYFCQISNYLDARGWRHQLEHLSKYQLEYCDALFRTVKSCQESQKSPEYAALLLVDSYNAHVDAEDQKISLLTGEC